MGNATDEAVSLEVREFQTFLFLTLRLWSPEGKWAATGSGEQEQNHYDSHIF